MQFSDLRRKSTRLKARLHWSMSVCNHLSQAFSLACDPAEQIKFNSETGYRNNLNKMTFSYKVEKPKGLLFEYKEAPN